MYAICDIGSNTVKIHFFKVYKNDFERFDSITYPAKLINYIESGRMKNEGIDLLCSLLYNYKAEAKKRDCVISAFATASLRRADNAGEIISRVEEHTGIHIDLVSGEKEAELCTLGVIHEIGADKRGLLMDMGGGSTEVIEIANGNIISAGSMPFGSLSLYTDYVKGDLPTVIEKEKIINLVRTCYSERGTPNNVHIFIGGGTGKAILKVMEAGKGLCTVDTKNFFALEEKIMTKKISFDHIASVVPDRATTLTPGLIAMCEVIRLSKAEKATFVTAGAREGYLLSII